ncbi:hypothetical protein A6A40_19215 (plasmid) [Azospirillum humicireducens]|uniref:Uncharacterized protein n=1 Tax=Azospirillum humicireducens TaxID=1226968 RepID=A0A2R4VS03_9PROT|nr:hypothetical protein [Azospirillum humicireducens]AWB07197.1 hypothetical protein A6A40_19215 [Azospirillum humicireducens]
MTKQASPKYAPEVREPAVRMVFEHEDEHAWRWTAISSRDEDHNRRLLEPIGNIPHAEAEARYYTQNENVTMAA